jgi:hypothetical protein
VRALGLVEPPIQLPLSLDSRIDHRVLLFSFALGTMAGVIAGLLPALKSSSRSIVQDVRGGITLASAAGRPWTLRDALVVGQMAVTVVLLICAALSRGASPRRSGPTWAFAATASRC